MPNQNSTQMTRRAFLAVGLMLFALFFGAGNLIFPAALGQRAGTNVWWAVMGFVLTGVGLPLAGVLAMGYSGCRNVQELAGRVHPLFGILFTLALYLSIGPAFAIPRTGTVSFEIAVRKESGQGLVCAAKGAAQAGAGARYGFGAAFAAAL